MNVISIGTDFQKPGVNRAYRGYTRSLREPSCGTLICLFSVKRASESGGVVERSKAVRDGTDGTRELRCIGITVSCKL